MNCPYCKAKKTTIVSTVPQDDTGPRRKRSCPSCQRQFWTTERHTPIELGAAAS